MKFILFCYLLFCVTVCIVGCEHNVEIMNESNGGEVGDDSSVDYWFLGEWEITSFDGKWRKEIDSDFGEFIYELTWHSVGSNSIIRFDTMNSTGISGDYQLDFEFYQYNGYDDLDWTDRYQEEIDVMNYAASFDWLEEESVFVFDTIFPGIEMRVVYHSANILREYVRERKFEYYINRVAEDSMRLILDVHLEADQNDESTLKYFHMMQNVALTRK